MRVTAFNVPPTAHLMVFSKREETNRQTDRQTRGQTEGTPHTLINYNTATATATATTTPATGDRDPGPLTINGSTRAGEHDPFDGARFDTGPENAESSLHGGFDDVILPLGVA